MNPHSLRCVKVGGRIGQQLARGGPQPTYGIQQFFAQRPPAAAQGLAGAFGAAPAAHATFWDRPAAAPAPATRGLLLAQGAVQGVQCAPGQNRNPMTGRCIRVGGRTYKKLHPVTRALPLPPAPALPRAATTAAARRTSSEEALTLPVGTAAPAPLGDAAIVQPWIRDNCKNKTDPIRGLAWTDADTTQLQEVIRLHNRTCVMASDLNASVKAQHRNGTPATVPGEISTSLTLDDFKALRSTMRRRDPAYKLPARRHQPAPVNWQLYVSSDNRSGPEFASVMIVDVSKARATPTGYQYPPESVMIDAGFIPTSTPAGSLCQPQLIVDVLDRLAKSNRLLEPVAGGWKPVFTPRSKAYWSTERAEKVGRLCRDLTRALTTPL
jgi:hypothetical protein